jgi:hypothetical protein
MKSYDPKAWLQLLNQSHIRERKPRGPKVKSKYVSKRAFQWHWLPAEERDPRGRLLYKIWQAQITRAKDQSYVGMRVVLKCAAHERRWRAYVGGSLQTNIHPVRSVNALIGFMECYFMRGTYDWSLLSKC